MSGESAFEKRYVDPKNQSKFEELLEMFNLPPKAINFLKTYKRPIQISLAIVLVVVVSWSLYSSYRERKIEDGASALALAMKDSGVAQRDALNTVANEYGSTPSGLWAEVELAHLLIKEKKYVEASAAYKAVQAKLNDDSPLLGLTVFGQAQAEEAAGNDDAASALYEQLAGIDGYTMLGYSGMGRIFEANGELEKALGIYGQYLSVVGDSPDNPGDKVRVEAQIARLKARQ